VFIAESEPSVSDEFVLARNVENDWEKRTDASHLDAHLASLLNELVVGPTELESVTSTVSR
jgi:hypothetical protein